MNCVKYLQSPVGYIGIPLQAVLTFYYRIGSNLNKQKERNDMGAFNNHVDKRGWVGGLKIAIFVHV